MTNLRHWKKQAGGIIMVAMLVAVMWGSAIAILTFVSMVLGIELK